MRRQNESRGSEYRSDKQLMCEWPDMTLTNTNLMLDKSTDR